MTPSIPSILPSRGQTREDPGKIRENWEQAFWQRLISFLFGVSYLSTNYNLDVFMVEKGHTMAYNAAREQSHSSQGFLWTLGGPVSGAMVGTSCHLVVASVVCIAKLIQVYFMWLLSPLPLQRNTFVQTEETLGYNTLTQILFRYVHTHHL